MQNSRLPSHVGVVLLETGKVRVVVASVAAHVASKTEAIAVTIPAAGVGPLARLALGPRSGDGVVDGAGLIEAGVFDVAVLGLAELDGGVVDLADRAFLLAEVLVEQVGDDDVGWHGLAVGEGPLSAAVCTVLADVVEGRDLFVLPQAVEELVEGLDEAPEGELGVALFQKVMAWSLNVTQLIHLEPMPSLLTSVVPLRPCTLSVPPFSRMRMKMSRRRASAETSKPWSSVRYMRNTSQSSSL